MLPTFRFIKSELTVLLHQICGWCTHISKSLELLVIQSDDAGETVCNVKNGIPESNSHINNRDEQ